MDHRRKETLQNSRDFATTQKKKKKKRKEKKESTTIITMGVAKYIHVPDALFQIPDHLG